MATATYKVGDKVRSAEDSSDVLVMEGVYKGTVAQVRRAKGTPDGHVYIVRGYMVALPNSKYANLYTDTTPGDRQLWSSHLTPDV